jgi:hypothetical protein
MTINSPLNGNATYSGSKNEGSPVCRHLQWVLGHHQRLQRLINNNDNEEPTVTISGSGMTLADVVAASQYDRLST